MRRMQNTSPKSTATRTSTTRWKSLSSTTWKDFRAAPWTRTKRQLKRSQEEVIKAKRKRRNEHSFVAVTFVCYYYLLCCCFLAVCLVLFRSRWTSRANDNCKYGTWHNGNVGTVSVGQHSWFMRTCLSNKHVVCRSLLSTLLFLSCCFESALHLLGRLSLAVGHQCHRNDDYRYACTASLAPKKRDVQKHTRKDQGCTRWRSICSRKQR